jgi:LPS sulfotransferase NodH
MSGSVTNQHRGRAVWWREDAVSVRSGVLLEVSGSIASVRRLNVSSCMHVARVHLTYRDAFDQAIDPCAARQQDAWEREKRGEEHTDGN